MAPEVIDPSSVSGDVKGASISVVIPARNAEATLPTAVQSLLDQSLEDFELVLVDHRSTDATRSLMDQFARQDFRVKIASCQGTFIEAVNLAWQISEGDLIARMDADDFSHPNRLEQQRNFLSKHPDIACCGTQVKILKKDPQTGRNAPPDEGYADYEKWINSVVSPDQIAAERFIDSPLPNPATMIRREFLEKFDGYQDEVWAEDYDLWLRLLHNDYSLGKVDEVLLDWFDGEGRATRTQNRYSLENFQRAKAHYLGLLPQVKERGVAICGAGPIGKKMAGFLMKEKVSIHTFFEVNERQIGNQIGDITVRNSLEVGKLLGKCVLLAAVGLRGARENIRSLAKEAGYVEGSDFFCVA